VLVSRPSLKFDEKAIEELLKGEGSSAMTRLRKRHPEWFSEEYLQFPFLFSVLR